MKPFRSMSSGGGPWQRLQSPIPGEPAAVGFEEIGGKGAWQLGLRAERAGIVAHGGHHLETPAGVLVVAGELDAAEE